MNSVAIVALFIAALALLQVALWAMGGQREPIPGANANPEPRWDSEPPMSRIPAVSALLERLPGMLALQRLQAQAGSSMTVLAFLVASFACAIGAQIAITIVLDAPARGALVGMAAGAFPFLALARAKGARAERVSAELPRALRALTRLANSGQGPAQAIRETALEMEGPLARELGRTFAEQRDGRPLTEALLAMADRVPTSVDLRILVTAIVLSTESGGNLGDLLGRIESSLSARIVLAQKARAETSQARLSATILAAMPPLGVLGVALVQPDYFTEGWADPLGKVLYVGAAVWMTIGIAVIFSLIRRER